MDDFEIISGYNAAIYRTATLPFWNERQSYKI